MYLCICMRVCLCKRACMFVYACITLVNMRACMFVYACVYFCVGYACVYVCVGLGARVCLCMRACICVCIRTWVHTSRVASPIDHYNISKRRLIFIFNRKGEEGGVSQITPENAPLLSLLQRRSTAPSHEGRAVRYLWFWTFSFLHSNAAVFSPSADIQVR